MNLFDVSIISKFTDISHIYGYCISGLINTQKIMHFFDNYLLKTKKRLSYLLWKELHNKLSNKEYLNKTLWLTLKYLSIKINNT
jgi:hypothetical protein